MIRALRRLGTWIALAAIATAVVLVRTFDHEEGRP